MLQSFDVTSDPTAGVGRLALLRDAMIAIGLDGYLVPRADAHQGEYVPARDERLGWLTGFTGSAGFCAALRREAGVFVDGRYRVQVREQISPDVYTPVNWPEVSLGSWLIENLPDGGKVGFDPWLYSVAQIDDLEKNLSDTEISVVQTGNLIDEIWHDQPNAPSAAVFEHPLEFAGESREDKCARLAADLRSSNQTAALLTLPDSIMWLLNIRGADIPRNPVAHGFAILMSDGSVDLFVDPEKLSAISFGDALTVRIKPLSAFLEGVGKLSGKIRADKSTLPCKVADACGGELIWDGDPCVLPKACKNETEINGMIAAHLRDGVAMCEFLCWVDAQEPGSQTEISVASELEQYRRSLGQLHDISFETISGTGPHAALPHYRVSTESNLTVDDGHLLLVDSGGQYLDGTTDITRTMAIGTPTAEHRECFTRVLQGMIAVCRAQFPRGLSGRDLDALARFPLWTAGKDYDHGTGHGVGAFLSVHEGPQRISRASEVYLQEGMILSNEPGYYKVGSFGIRIENLIVVQTAPRIEGDDGRDMLSFFNLTWVPIDKRLIDVSLLSPAEVDWINDYHAQTHDKISPRLSEHAKAWLNDATSPL
ncbi:MAG: aminopeptidase P family protein [Paracoccaceae bacterium]|nr:aminopeptidase P family protein [Paracoccaceae bacterium]MDG2257251.1 aminopeptidase P family protein [Paracoccaceae bacterium]